MSLRRARMMLRIMAFEAKGGKLPKPDSKKWKKAKKTVEAIYKEFKD